MRLSSVPMASTLIDSRFIWSLVILRYWVLTKIWVKFINDVRQSFRMIQSVIVFTVISFTVFLIRQSFRMILVTVHSFIVLLINNIIIAIVYLGKIDFIKNDDSMLAWP